MKIGTPTQRDDTVCARADVGGVEHQWSYTAPELSLDRAADALLVASLLPAMRSAEPLVSVDPVSPRLLQSLPTAQDVFRSWRTRNRAYADYQRVPVEAEPRPVQPLAVGRGVAAFFTAGVDSFYTALKHRAEIDALVYVRGFDVALDDARVDSIVLDGVRSAAGELDLPLVVVSTDLRAFSDRYARWDHYHGAALASVAHLLASHYATVYVPATMTYGHLGPLGTHPLLDPLWSTEEVELVHDGCEATRLEKLSIVASEAAARHWLRVCWENRDGRYNCGRCEKCLRTMVAMDALGVLDAFDCFPHEISSIDIARVHLPEMAYTWEASLELLETTGRDPVIARCAAASPVRPDDARGASREVLRTPNSSSRAFVIRARRLRRRADEVFGDAASLQDREHTLVERIVRVAGTASPPSLPSDALEWPVSGRVTSRFGDRVGRFHAGIDIAAPEGTPVVAAAAGKVVIAESLAEFGNVVVVDHGGGCTTLSAHLRELLVAAGDAVTREEMLGRVGSTGRATGPHLHFETRLNGAPQDPSSVLPPEGDPAEALRIELMATMRGVLAGVRDVVLVGTTLHDNAGDSLIWLGQLAVLAELGIRVHAVVHPASFDRRPFDAAPPGAVVLLSGGGNFGDLWPFVHRHREWILREITDRRIVQFPQSLHFRDDAALVRVQHSLAARDDVSLMWRDRESLGAARDLFPGVDAHLVPDVAFARRPPRVPVSPGDRIVWIGRDDREGSALRRSGGPSGRVTDWRLDRAPTFARELLWLTARAERRVPSVVGPRPRLVLYNRSALMTAYAAARLVASARVVVTDRLHAHVLCTMFAVPHVLLDDGYGKIRAFLDTWPVVRGRAELAASPEDAAERAARLLAGTYDDLR